MSQPLLWTIVGVGGVVLVTAALAANEYNKQLNGPRYISRNWTESETPAHWRNKLPQVRLSNNGPKYRWTESDTARRTRVRNQYEDNQLDPNSDYEKIVHRPSDGWGGKRKTRRK